MEKGKGGADDSVHDSFRRFQSPEKKPRCARYRVGNISASCDASSNVIVANNLFVARPGRGPVVDEVTEDAPRGGLFRPPRAFINRLRLLHGAPPSPSSYLAEQRLHSLDIRVAIFAEEFQAGHDASVGAHRSLEQVRVKVGI